MHLVVNAAPDKHRRNICSEHLPPAGTTGQLPVERHSALKTVPGAAAVAGLFPWAGIGAGRGCSNRLRRSLLLQAFADNASRRMDPAAAGCMRSVPVAKTAPAGNREVRRCGRHWIIDGSAYERFNDTLQRLGLQYIPGASGGCCADRYWWNGEPFDGILLDAPWQRASLPDAIPILFGCAGNRTRPVGTETQRQLLDAFVVAIIAAAFWLHCTCSVFRAEGEEQVAAFLLPAMPCVYLFMGNLLPVQGSGNMLGQNILPVPWERSRTFPWNCRTTMVFTYALLANKST